MTEDRKPILKKEEVVVVDDNSSMSEDSSKSNDTRWAKFNGSDFDSEDDEMKTDSVPAAQLRH